MIYATASYADAEHSQVIGIDSNGNAETVPVNFTLFRQPEHGPQGFLAAGGIIAAYEAPPTPMPDLEPWRFFAMLDMSGKRPELEAFIDSLPDPSKTVARNKLERSLVFQRQNDLVLAAQQAMGLTDQQLDALWTQALSL